MVFLPIKYEAILFQTNDIVVYPAQGVGKIESVAQQAIGDVQCEFYVVRIIANNITLMVPVHNAANVGLRSLMDVHMAENILQSFCSTDESMVYIGQNWNRRYREYSEKIKSVAPEDVAQVVRELLVIGKGKELSFGERRLLEHAMLLITGELAYVLGLDELTLRDRITAYYTPPQESAENATQALVEN